MKGKWTRDMRQTGEQTHVISYKGLNLWTGSSLLCLILSDIYTSLPSLVSFTQLLPWGAFGEGVK